MEDDNKLSYFFSRLRAGAWLWVCCSPPSPGAETRALLRDKADESTEYVKRKSTELRDPGRGGGRSAARNQVQRHKREPFCGSGSRPGPLIVRPSIILPAD